jgi:hypothetical protein
MPPSVNLLPLKDLPHLREFTVPSQQVSWLEWLPRLGLVFAKKALLGVDVSLSNQVRITDHPSLGRPATLNSTHDLV